MIRLLVCDDSAEARKLLHTILADDREIEIVGDATNGSEAIALALDLHPDVVLMDVAMAELTGALCAAAFLTSSEAGLSLAGLAGAPTRDRLSSAPGVVVRAFREATTAHADAHELAELYRLGIPCGQAIAMPLVADGVQLGALFVAMPANVQLELDQELVASVADLAAASLAQERRLALTFAEARRDALTGLPNRRAFDEQLDRALAEAGPGEPGSLVLLDVDEFKVVNDTGGHAAGDEGVSTPPPPLPPPGGGEQAG